MKFRFSCVGFLALFMLPNIAQAAGNVCATATRLVADGRILDFDFIPQSASGFYAFYAVQGRSYSVEVRDDIEDDNTDLNTVTVTNGCAGASVGLNDTHLLDPVLQANAFRGSFVANSSGPIDIAVANANSGAGHYVSITVSDTTLFNPRWSSSPGFHTEYGFTNTTNANVHVTLTLFNPDGSVNTTHGPDAVPAHGTIFYDTRNISAGVALNLAPNGAGTSTLAHDGPPAAIVADVYIINAGFSTGPFIQPGKFEAARQTR